jgi:dihydroorotase
MFSDDGRCVSDPRLMRRALEYVKAFDGVIAQHAEEPRLTVDAQMHEGVVSARLGLLGWPAVAEEAIIARDVLLAEHVDARLHICHVSTAGSVEILRWAKQRARAAGRSGRITAEVTPHHLLLTDSWADGYDPVFKVNPPLRTADDVAALRAGLVEGVIDAVATDHAPHAVQDKECEWGYARPGMLGLETALSIAVDALLDEIGWDGIAERMSRVPARIAGLSGHGHDPVVGQPANLTLIDPSARWVVEPTSLASRSMNTPYAGMELPARVVATFLRGRPTVLDGKATR